MFTDMFVATTRPAKPRPNSRLAAGAKENRCRAEGELLYWLSHWA
jgi:hypothetical protein